MNDLKEAVKAYEAAHEAALAKKDAYIDALQSQIDQLKQSYWEARAIMGFDNDGDKTPFALVHPSISELMLQDAKSVRADLDERMLVSIDDVLTAASPSKPECTHVFEWLNHNPSNQHCIHCGKIA